MTDLSLFYKNYIAGEWRDSSSGRRYEVKNPAALSEVLHSYPKSNSDDVKRSIESAEKAYSGWKHVSLAEKIQVMRKTAELIRTHRDAIAKVITQENGKLISESYVEIDSALLELEFQLGEGARQFGVAGDCFKGGLLGMSRKEPLGVVSAIIPWNFPFNVPFRKIVPALLAGNTIILKPASQTPAVGEIVVKLMYEAGLPENVLQFVTGSGSELSDGLVGSPAIRAVTFTGSTEVGRKIAVQAAHNFTRTQLEMGGKNPLVVLADADLDLAAEACIVGAFSCAGQWCTATSRLIVEDAVADELIEKVCQRARDLVLGTGDNPKATIGPVCGEEQYHGIKRHIKTAMAEGAKLILGGEECDQEELKDGCFIQPTIFDFVEESMSIAREEVFGPVLSVMRVGSYCEALRVANNIPYGLSSSIFTQSLELALDFIDKSEVGLTHVNVHSAYKEPQLCFGGVKDSGFGLPEAGSVGIEFFQEDKSIYIKK